GRLRRYRRFPSGCYVARGVEHAVRRRHARWLARDLRFDEYGSTGGVEKKPPEREAEEREEGNYQPEPPARGGWRGAAVDLQLANTIGRLSHSFPVVLPAFASRILSKVLYPDGVTDDIHRILREVFGFTRFQGKQEAAITTALAGRDSLVLMPTGGGKSLCYQVPALVREGVAVVVSPLIALMQDQVAALTESGVQAAYLNSTLSYTEQREVPLNLREGRLKLFYVAPERLLQEQTLSLLTSLPVSLIAIDEAHCVSQWGHDFRTDYVAVNELAPRLPR